ncbi:MAG: alpha/beta hydrolase [Lachnospiraceae bacterium]|nr:alpha/beta hydrolase [Lachnospiraceae bacterium]
MKLYETEIPARKGSGQSARLQCYLQEYSPKLGVNERPLILILPGGAYAYTSDREGEPIAFAFLGQGYHAAVLRYSTAEYVGDATAGDSGKDDELSLDPEARMQVARAIAHIKENATAWNVDPDRIFLWGASAGGHLAAHYACTWQDEMPELTGLSENTLKIRGLLLSYPVITSGDHANRKSITNLLRERAEDPEELRRVSLEHRVNASVPPVFLWATWTDGSVPAENSLLFAQALRKASISTELHLFPVGGHGLALADARTMGPEGKENVPYCSVWFDLACAWLKRVSSIEEA